VRTVKQLLLAGLIKPEEKSLIEEVEKQFALSITPQVIDLIHSDITDNTDNNSLDDPILKQFLPSSEELNIKARELIDPIGDNLNSPVKGIVHQYPDRCLLMPVMVCPVYCRFCFRREQVAKTKGLSKAELDNAYRYIQEHKEIWEVILTGGDPLILKPKVLSEILKSLVAIPHVEVIRIHTRVPAVQSDKITDEMLNVLKTEKPLYVLLHSNHPNEFTPIVKETCARIVDKGIPMLSQTVLLKGINDNEETLGELMRTFVKNRIKPFYLHHPDLAKGTSHFRVSIAKGQKLMRYLRGRFSGLCQPTYVLSIPGGYGKAPIQDSYIHSVSSMSTASLGKCEESYECYDIEDYNGVTHRYEGEL